MVVIRSGSEYHWYMHLAPGSIPDDIQEGQPVSRGQVIGTEGETGWASGPHLHFQVQVSGWLCCTGSGDLRAPSWPGLTSPPLAPVNFVEYAWEEFPTSYGSEPTFQSQNTFLSVNPYLIVNRASITADGTQGNGNSRMTSISGDGRYVAFASAANNLVSGDTNNMSDVFVWDRQTGQIARISIGAEGMQSNGASDSPAISADGRFITFASYATNLVANDSNGFRDIFVHDRQTGQTVLASVTAGGEQADDQSLFPAISPDGGFVAFASYARNLVDDDNNGWLDIFLHNMQSGSNTLVSVSSAGIQANNLNGHMVVSEGGRFVAWESIATNLVVGDTNFVDDIFVRDLDLSETTRISVTSITGGQSNGVSSFPSISADGRLVAFASDATNLVEEADINNRTDIFVHNRETGESFRISDGFDGLQANGSSGGPVLSVDGNYVGFISQASNLITGDGNGHADIFVYERQTNRMVRIPLETSDDNPPNLWSRDVSIAGDGQFAAFSSFASNLVANDTLGFEDVFVAVVSFTPIPPNNDLDNPNNISLPPYGGNQDTSLATVTGSDPIPSCGVNVGKTVWYKITTTVNQVIQIVTTGSNFDTVLSIWAGVPGSLTEVGCNDNAAGEGEFVTASDLSSQLELYAAADVTYYIMVGGKNDTGGNLQFLAVEIPFADCNADTAVDAGDLSALTLEIFDGDGSDPAQTPGGDFAGNPACDANADNTIDAGDLSCGVLIGFAGPGGWGG
jgi:Tol biopolymer transport system component